MRGEGTGGGEPRGGRWRVSAADEEVGVVVQCDGRWRGKEVTVIGGAEDGVVSAEVTGDSRTWEA